MVNCVSSWVVLVMCLMCVLMLFVLVIVSVLFLWWVDSSYCLCRWLSSIRLLVMMMIVELSRFYSDKCEVILCKFFMCIFWF